ncbi:MAG: hypothetical protein ACKVP3_23660 [Hyphomicrobiaceae bacterium]
MFSYDQGTNPLQTIFGSLLGIKPTVNPAADTIPQAPINYDRMQAIMNSGILKNPNASMDVAPKPTPAPVQQQPAPQKQPSFLEMLFGRLAGPGSDAARMQQINSDDALRRRWNNVDGGS